MRKYIIYNIINYLSKLFLITLQKSTDGKNTNVSKNVTSRYLYKHEDLSLGGQRAEIVE